MKKVFSAQVSNAYHSSTDKAIQFGKENSTQTLSVTVESAAALVNLPIGNIEGIWQKATTLLQKEGAIAPVLGKDPKARMVLSYSSDYPHLVTTGKKKGSYMCDVKCPNWKSQNLCSHSVAGVNYRVFIEDKQLVDPIKTFPYIDMFKMPQMKAILVYLENTLLI